MITLSIIILIIMLPFSFVSHNETTTGIWIVFSIYTLISIALLINFVRKNEDHQTIIWGAILPLVITVISLFMSLGEHNIHNEEKHPSSEHDIKYSLSARDDGYSWKSSSESEKRSLCEILENNLKKDNPRFTSSDYYQMCENFYSGNDERRLKMTIAQTVAFCLLISAHQ